MRQDRGKGKAESGYAVVRLDVGGKMMLVKDVTFGLLDDK